MSDVPAERFPLDTRDAFPRWAVYVMGGGALLIGIVGTIGLASQKNPAAFFFLVFPALFIWFTHKWSDGFADPRKNFVDLDDDGFTVSLFAAFASWTEHFSYSSVQQVEPNASHGSWFGWRWPHSIPPGKRHVDIHLNAGRIILFGGFGSAPYWVTVVHLDVQEPRTFVQALQDRVASSEPLANPP